jgi:long-chain acyl-CoA synthetase
VRHLALTREGVRALAAAAGTGAEVDSPQDPESLAVLLSTAGTSGVPKAAMLTHRALLSHLDQIARLGFLGPDDVLLAALPLFHVFGLNAVLGSWLRSGGRLVIMDGFAGVFDVIMDEKVSNLPLAPALIPDLIADERSRSGLGTVRTVLCGAAPLPDELRDEFTSRTGLRIDQGYGLTEAAPGVSATIGGPLLGHGHVGRPLPGVEVRIGDGSDESEPGEIFVRGPNLFSGYWPDGAGGPGGDGWFGTGDIGYLADGELFLGDRTRELIMVNGFSVHPAEVEEAIAELDGVESVAVLGRPDPRTGEQVVAFVTGPEVTAEAIREHCAGRLARFKRPGLVAVVEELPRGATGKVQKGLLRRTLAEKWSPAADSEA